MERAKKYYFQKKHNMPNKTCQLKSEKFPDGKLSKVRTIGMEAANAARDKISIFVI